jgi:hypothetical protein
MCNLATITAFVCWFQVSVAVVGVFVASALTLNITIFGAPGAPVLMGVALAAGIAGLVLAYLARDHMVAFCSCASDFINKLLAIIILLAAFCVAAGAAVLSAWIPVIGAAAIGTAAVLWAIFALACLSLVTAYFAVTACTTTQPTAGQIIIFFLTLALAELPVVLLAGSKLM